MFCFFKWFLDVFAEMLFDKLPASRMVWHVLFDIVNNPFEDDKFVLFFVLLI